MKTLILLICLMTGITACSQDKSGIFENIENRNNLTVYKNAIFFTGYNSLPHKEESDSVCSWLLKYDRNLHLLWSIKFTQAEIARIEKIEILNDKIYALVTNGKSTRNTFHHSITLYTISQQGKIIDQLKIEENTLGPSTNIIVDKNKLYMAYTKPAGNNYSTASPVTPIIAEYDPTTKALIKKKGNRDYAIYELLKHNSRLLAATIEPVGMHDAIIQVSERKTPFQNNADSTLKKTVFQVSNSDIFLSSHCVGNELIFLTRSHDGMPDNSKRFLKTFRINLITDKITEKILYYKDYNWEFVQIPCYSAMQTTWVVVANKNKECFFVEIDKTGTPVSKIPIKKPDAIMPFVILDNTQVYCLPEKLSITHAPRSSFK